MRRELRGAPRLIGAPPLIGALWLGGCAAPPVTGAQSPIDLHMVVHIDPLPRRGTGECDDPAFTACAGLSALPWRERVENLAWLADRWTETGRTVDLQWGPELALSLVEEPAHLASLEVGMADAGEADPAAAVAETVALGQDAVRRLLDAEVAAFASHIHTVGWDPSGLWGTGPLAGGGPHPCDAWDGEPLQEALAASTEASVWYGALGAQAIADAWGVPVRTWTGAVPRVLADKALVLSDPDALDPVVDRDFPEGFQPWLLGSAYSECMIRALGHPPFELYRVDDQRSLGGGDGPLAHPGEPVVGQVDDHLDLPADGAAGAAMRRILQGLLAWRVAALEGQPDRPWAYSWHTHLFHIDAGTVAPKDPTARELSSVDGMPLRQDIEAVAAFADRYTAGAWQGVEASDGGGPVAWGLPGERDPLDAPFVFGDPDAPPPANLAEVTPEDSPYPLLISAALVDAHLVCTGALEGVEVYGLLQCDGGWAWGGSAAGYHCADPAVAPRWRYVLVPAAPACLAGVEVVRAASVASDTWAQPRWCEGGLEVPLEGLLVDPVGDGGALALACTAGIATGG